MIKMVKRTKFNFLVGLMALVSVLYSCADDDPEVVIEITEESVVDIIAASLSEEDGGFANYVDNLIEDIEDECGFLETESLTDAETIGVRSFSVSYEISTEVICNENDEFQELNCSFTSNREADLIRLDTESFSEGEWSLVKRDTMIYVLEGLSEYDGKETFKVRDQNTYTSSTTYSSDELTVNQDGDFINGVLSIEYVLTSTTDDQRDESGTLTITDTNIGLLDVSTFEFLYEIDLKTGDLQQVER